MGPDMAHDLFSHDSYSFPFCFVTLTCGQDCAICFVKCHIFEICLIAPSWWFLGGSYHSYSSYKPEASLKG